MYALPHMTLPGRRLKRLVSTIAFGLACLAAPSVALPAGRDVKYAPSDAWLLPPPMPTSAPDPLGAPMRVVYTDTQVRLTADGEEALDD